MDIAFTGIGRMGMHMAARLIAAGHRLAVHDINPAACASLVERGAQLARTPGEAAARSEVVMSCVPGPAEVAAVMEGPQGILAGARKGSLIVEMSTIGPAQSRRLAAAARERGLAYIDAPISNGVPAAERGELTIMVGGDKADYDRAEPALRPMATRIYHMGPIGSGNIAKIINQVIYLSYVATFCETASFARHAGLDVNTMIDVMRNSVAGDPMMTRWERRLESGDTKPGFMIRRVLKDLGLGAQACADLGFDAPLLEGVIRSYRDAEAEGHGGSDITALYTGRAAQRL